ncbi:MAG: KEOPS complex kinase/ATPase Bud32 [Nanoarchaeota archaeon]|nr:Kae1-associated serine/threonine protein kinase [Nanoarchaeota archaeon]MBU4299747.1 Kae1-associated serine/threonine protein kinase [Nanoarchaeota archaeon]MBU4452561.1 Kae1-associated serine/threonine protein kinase [Nanoarchaeota archaeon]MCG2723526.1 Kae1-associated serine/threonine protein kinase [archaeon]
MQLLRKGAEADIYRTDSSVLKDRVPKSYRIKALDDKLRKERTRAEAKLLERAANIVSVPKVLNKNMFSIEMEFIDGPRVKDILGKNNFCEICAELSQSIVALHKAEIIHGDLTTSNLILKGGKIYFIDFGLGFFSKKPEDMAVDLHTLFEALNSTHSGIADEAIELVLSEYEKSGGKKEVILRLEKLKSRGRYIRRSKNGVF